MSLDVIARRLPGTTYSLRKRLCSILKILHSLIIISDRGLKGLYSLGVGA